MASLCPRGLVPVPWQMLTMYMLFIFIHTIHNHYYGYTLHLLRDIFYIHINNNASSEGQGAPGRHRLQAHGARFGLPQPLLDAALAADVLPGRPSLAPWDG